MLYDAFSVYSTVMRIHYSLILFLKTPEGMTHTTLPFFLILHSSSYHQCYFFIAYSPDSSIETSGLLIKHLISGILIAKEYKKKNVLILNGGNNAKLLFSFFLFLKKCPSLISSFQCTQTTIISSIGNH